MMTKQIALAFSLVAASGAASAHTGCLTTARDTIVTSGTGLCWRTSAWTPAQAVPPCDPVLKARAAPQTKVVPKAPPPVEPVAVAAEPKKISAVAGPQKVAAAMPPSVAPVPQPPAPVIKRLAFSTELLFAFDSAELRPAGRAKLGELMQDIKGAEIGRVVALGHADRVGSEGYNFHLSQRRAQVVQDYLAELGIDAKPVHAAGKGESEPVTGEQCRSLRNNALISCLQPDRRVEIEISGTW